MKWKYGLLISMVSGALLLSACSNADENTVVVVDEDTGEEKVVAKEIVEQQQKEATAYSEHLTKTFNTSIGLHDTFAHALDQLFTKESSPGQFANILKQDVIDSSREVLDEAEKYNFPTEYFEMNQMVVTNLNNQHQLFLDAVNEAIGVSETENAKMDIVGLRERLATVKQEYLAIVNTWKNGGEVQQ